MAKNKNNKSKKKGTHKHNHTVASFSFSKPMTPQQMMRGYFRVDPRVAQKVKNLFKL